MITRVQIAAYTHTGLYRKRNEDSLLVLDQVIYGVAMEKPTIRTIGTFPIVLAVADGIGGCVAGDIASREVLLSLAGLSPAPGDEETLLRSIYEATEHLERLVTENPALDGFGTTIAGVLITSKELLFFSCGDSRVYYKAPTSSGITLMTKDHSVIQEMIDAGTLTEKEARSHPLGHIITSCLSGSRVRRIPDIRIYTTPVTPGSRIIMCTDGVWDYGGDGFLKAALIDDITIASKEIAKACFNEGAPDNLTYIIADPKK